MVEDSRYGVQAARAAGMRVFGYCGGLTPAEWLHGPGTVVFDDMRELRLSSPRRDPRILITVRATVRLAFPP